MEEFRVNLKEAISKYVNLLPSVEAHNEISEAEYLREQAIELKMKIEGRISRKTSHPCMSKISSTFQVSVLS